VRQLVEMHGGTVAARSEGEGRGAELIVRLPAAGPRAGSDAAEPAVNDGAELKSTARSESARASGCRRILVVDDNVDAATSLEALLRMLGHEVRQAHDGIAAVDVARAFEPEVIFMDIGMPRLNGLEAARRIRELPLATRPSIVALTGWGQAADRKRSEQAGIDEHLVKPVELTALHHLLDRPS
jgi:CheY-like chemotaxis protein